MHYFYLKIHGAVQHLQVIGLEHYLAVGIHIHPYAGPIRMDLAVLLNKDVIENVVGNAIRPLLRNGGIGQGLMEVMWRPL